MCLCELWKESYRWCGRRLNMSCEGIRITTNTASVNHYSGRHWTTPFIQMANNDKQHVEQRCLMRIDVVTTQVCRNQRNCWITLVCKKDCADESIRQTKTNGIKEKKMKKHKNSKKQNRSANKKWFSFFLPFLGRKQTEMKSFVN